MLLTLVVFLLLPTGCLYLWPITDHVLDDDLFSPLEKGLIAFSLSIGLLTLVMFWVGLIPGLKVLHVMAPLVIVAGLAAGWMVNRAWFSPQVWQRYWAGVWQQLIRFDMRSLAMLTILAVGVLILVHGLYYPFIGDDTLSRYGLQASQIYQARNFPQSVEGYPPLIPLSMAAIWFVLGEMNEHLARMLPVLMTVGMIGATYALGRKLKDRATGLMAALLIALTPIVIRNGTLAYTDIPTTFPLAMVVLVTLVWWRTGQRRYAALAGILLGIALFTKQSALTWLASLAVLPVTRLIAQWRQGETPRWGDGGMALVGFVIPALLIAGPWYARNYLIGGMPNILPVAGAYHLLEPGIGWIGVLPTIGRALEFGPVLSVVFALGWIFGLGMAIYQGIQILRGDPSMRIPVDLIFAAVVIPYWAAWWSRFSFDGRFLVFIVPYVGVWTARIVMLMLSWLDKLSMGIPLPGLRYIFAVPILILLFFWGGRDRFGGMYYAVTQPFAPDTERLRRAKGSMVDLMAYVKANFDPRTDHIALMDNRMLYYLDGYNVESFYPLTMADLEGFDYLVHSSSIYGIYDNRLGWKQSEFYQRAWNETYFEPVYVSGGVHIMRIVTTDISQEAP